MSEDEIRPSEGLAIFVDFVFVWILDSSSRHAWEDDNVLGIYSREKGMEGGTRRDVG